MPKIRTIKPEFWLNEELAETTPSTRLFYIGLWNFSDDNGVFLWRPKRLKAQIFPYENQSVDKALKELESNGFIKHFTCNGQEYGIIPTFSNHQKIDSRYFRMILPKEDIPNEYTPSTPRGHDAGGGGGKEGKGGGGGEEGKNKYGVNKNVLLLLKEVKWLKERFGSSYEEKLTNFSNGIKMKPYGYTDHYLAICKWNPKESKSQTSKIKLT